MQKITLTISLLISHFSEPTSIPDNSIVNWIKMWVMISPKNHNYVWEDAKLQDLDICHNAPYKDQADLLEAKTVDCRICLQEGTVLGERHDDYDELLVSNPCKWKGYLHVNCLRQWLKVHRHIIFENQVWKSIIWTNLRWEICLDPYPDYIFCQLSSPHLYK